MLKRTVLVLTLFGIMLQKGGHSMPTDKHYEKILDYSEKDIHMKMLPMISRACNAICLGVYKEISPDYDNIVLSPFSICSLLAVCMRGASGKTHNELRNKLILKLTNKMELTKVYGSVFRSFEEDKFVNITTSNVLLVNKNVQLVTDAENDYRKSYNGSVQTFDPEMKELTSSYMNELVSSATDGMVAADLRADDISSDHALFMINTLQLNAKWKDVFDTADTYPIKFYVNQTSYVLTNTMYRRGMFRWNKSKKMKCDVIEIPYEGDRFAMYIFLPFEKDGLSRLEHDLSHNKLLRLEDVLSNMKEAEETDLYLPKFTIHQSFSLKKALEANRIKRMFDEKQADLSKLIKGGNVFIKEAFQKSAIVVNEMGTVAGAYSQMQGHLFSALPIFSASHPFLFVLRDQQTGFNIFMGKYAKP